MTASLAMSGPALAAPANDNFQFAQFLPGPNNSIGGRNDSACGRRRRRAGRRR